MNSWLKILEALDEGKFHNYFHGLTPRFLIGACQIPIGKKIETKELALDMTYKMFEEMKYFKSNGKIVTSNKCDIHNGPVMSLCESDWSDNSIFTTFEEIWNRYGNEIINGEYHINEWEQKILEGIFEL